MTTSFDILGLNTTLIEGLKKQKINKPTDIQAAVIPLALQNKDIIGESHTGSGKTLAYLLPVFQRIDSNKREMQAIILAPTHELVMQIGEQIKLLMENSVLPVTFVTVIGEVNINRQIEKLRNKPHIIVGSPGRIFELIQRKKITAHTIKTIIIDEGDKLLDQNNILCIKNIVKTTMRERQLMVFSANIDDNTTSAAHELMKAPEVIKINRDMLINPNINHMYFLVEQRDKLEILRKLIAAVRPNKAFVFINKTEKTQEITLKLRYHHINAYGIFGKSTKEERQKAIEGFRRGEIQILVASDIAARGLDIEGVTHIFNLDLPEDPKEYLHRVGRTGRNRDVGIAYSIVTEKESNFIKKLEKEFNINIKIKEVFKGKVLDPLKNKTPIKKQKKL